MAFTIRELNLIYGRTTGYCHICHKKVARLNYGVHGRRGAWEVEHSIPSVAAGTNHLNNLFVACIPCNRAKGVTSARTARAANSKKRAPLSRLRRKEAKEQNGFVGAVAGGALGLSFGGPIGAVIGAAIGALSAASENPDKYRL